jgi:hypothetical protein
MLQKTYLQTDIWQRVRHLNYVVLNKLTNECVSLLKLELIIT